MFVITGGGTGLGRALALALAKRDQPVLIVGRKNHALQETAACSPLIDSFCADLSNPDGRERLIQRITQQSTLQGLIHNAGIIDPILPMAQMQIHEWRTCIATNLEAPLFVTQALLPFLRQARVLHIGSGAAYFPIKGWSAYCVSKAALSMLTRCWQLEEPDLLMASVMPGIVDTPMQATIRQTHAMDPQKHEFFCQLKASGHLLAPEAVAEFLVWLLLDVAPESYVSQEWDIYDTKHHASWLRPPYTVPPIE